MQDPKEFYTNEKERLKKELAVSKKQLITSSLLRLFVFSLTGFGIYIFFGNFVATAVVILFGVSLFLYLLFRHTNLQYEKDVTEELIRINEIEINALNGNYSELDEGTEYINSEHYFSNDIDLFGRGSFFQYTNRTVISSGKDLLAQILTENTIDDIERKQKAIEELSTKPTWRQQFAAIASLINVQHSEKAILVWIANYKAVFSNVVAHLPIVFSIISTTLIVLLILELTPFFLVLAWFLIGLGVSGIYLKRVSTIYNDADKAKETFKQYHKLLSEIETETFRAELLRKKQEEIKAEELKASLIFKKFSKTLDALDQRNNVIIAIVGNGFFLRDTYEAIKVEKWILKYASIVESWFEVISFFDAQNSLANFAFNHPEYTFPILKYDQDVIKASKLGHPLLKKEECVTNNFTIEDRQFFIVTGANMAGKSTFLRTISLGILMANVGLPVCAISFDYSPIKLITSMRTSDSLTDHESYFFSELKRLKFIVEEIKSNNYFIILDEILKGTNSTDKAIGSKKFLKKLVMSNSTGLIATHDLSLCEVEKEHTDVENYYFDAEINNNELQFDYKLKKGVCKNMNASFLLKKMKIV